ncbi:MAG: nucleoside deaminase [Candidatus Fimenecus sp.]
MDKTDFMRIALDAAKQSAAEAEVPVGAVIVRNGEVVAVGRNRREAVKDALSHAEIEAIRTACAVLGGWRLWECEMFVTLEPCPMCAGAILNARIRKVTFGAYDPKNGALSSVMQMYAYPFTHKPAVEGGVFETECAAVLSDFFKKLRSPGDTES